LTTEELKTAARLVRIARDNALVFARNFRDQAEQRERRAAELTLQLDEMERAIASREEKQSAAAA